MDQQALDDANQAAGTVEVLGNFDRQTDEALLVEIQQLVKSHGLDIGGLAVKRLRRGSQVESS